LVPIATNPALLDALLAEEEEEEEEGEGARGSMTTVRMGCVSCKAAMGVRLPPRLVP